MKRLSLLATFLYVSTSFGMVQNNLKVSLDELFAKLYALEQVFALRVVALRVVVPPVVVPPVVTPPIPAKIKDPIKQMLAQFMASLTPEQRAEFQQLSPEERNARLAQVFAAGGQIKTPEPVPPAPVGPTPTQSPEPEPVIGKGEIPAPPFGAPPAPPAPVIKLPGAKPAAPKVVKEAPKVLTPEELANLGTEDKKRSDSVFLEFLAELSSMEFEKLVSFEDTVKQMLTGIRFDESFLKRSQLELLLDKDDGLLSIFSKEFRVDPTQIRSRLEELYGAFAQVKASSVSLLFKSFLPLLAGCLFEPAALKDAQLELICVTYVTAQRGPQPAKASVSRETQEKSDQPYLAVWKTLAQVENGINEVARRLNFVRMHPDFLLYQNMLWRGKEGSADYNMQKNNPLKGTLPLLLLLKYPQEQEFKVPYGAVETTIKSHMFNVDVFESTIDSKRVKQAFEWQREHSAVRITRTLQEYVLGQLKQIKSLSALKNLFNTAVSKYPADTAGLQGEIQQALAQLDPANPKIDIAAIAGVLQTLIKQQVPQDIQKNIETLVTTSMKDRALVGAVLDALKTPQQFNQALIASLQKGGNVALAEQLAARLTDLYRTPRDVYDLLVAQLTDKKALDDKQATIAGLIKPYGILLSAFRYFVEQYKRNPDNVDILKQNLGMLMKSINVIANPTSQLGTGKSAAEEIAGKLPAIRTQISNSKSLLGLPYAPELFDIVVNDNLIGKEKAAYYTGQLTKYDLYKGKGLAQLLGYIKEDKNPARVVEFLTELVSRANGVSIESPELKQLMQDISTALQGTYDKGIKPEYIE